MSGLRLQISFDYRLCRGWQALLQEMAVLEPAFPGADEALAVQAAGGGIAFAAVPWSQTLVCGRVGLASPTSVRYR